LLSVETGALTVLHDKQALWTHCMNREHDEQKDEERGSTELQEARSLSTSRPV
jgi:hypothetical protein